MYKKPRFKVLYDARHTPMCGLHSNNILPYMGVQYDVQVAFAKDKVFRLATYQAYNAFGLIGSECNGIVVFDDVNKRVVCDEICKISSGWNGASPLAYDAINALGKMGWSAFREVVNAQSRLRHEI
jgi:hypothetical protein